MKSILRSLWKVTFSLALLAFGMTSQAKAIPPGCGSICQLNCESFCGVGLGRCNPSRHCVCECW